jgi:hypothetical protein
MNVRLLLTQDFFNDPETIEKIVVIIQVLTHIFNIEFKEGLKSITKNCMIFNVILV